MTIRIVFFRWSDIEEPRTMAEKFALSDILNGIIEELVQAHKNADHRGFAVMKFVECEVEFAVEIEKDRNLGAKLWVLKLGGGRTKTDSNTVRIKFVAEGPTLAAVIRTDEPAPVPVPQVPRPLRKKKE